MATVALIGEHIDDLPLSAAGIGLSKIGYEVTARDQWRWTDLPDVNFAVIYGLRGQGQDILQHYKERNTPIVVIDHGYIERVNVFDDYGTGYFYVGMNGLGWVPKDVDGSRAAKLTYDIAPRRTGPVKRVLICGQVAWDASHRLGPSELNRTYSDMRNWFEGHGLEVRFRGHPLASDVDPGIKHDGVRRLSEALNDYDLVCTINSNSGLEAVMAGLPVMITKPCHYQSVAYPFGYDLEKVKPPTVSKVQGLIDRLAWSQFTAKEIAQGVPFEFLISRGLIPVPD